MSDTIFNTNTLDRSAHWEDSLTALTPVENREGRWYKREDYYAPLGYEGINGSKLRQLIYLINEYVKGGGSGGIVTGASVLSPQISMSALVGKHFNLPIEVVIGATKPETAIKHENVAIASAVGANFNYIKVAYNPALQREVKLMLDQPEYQDWYQLCYGITTPNTASPADITAFHEIGSYQSANIPDEVEHLLIPAGTCNSVVSVLYGIAKKPPAGLKRITLFGIGPNRLEWTQERLTKIEQATGLQIRNLFTYLYHNNRDLQHKHQANGPIVLEHYDLHTTKYAAYGDKMPFSLDGIHFHPTYEGKCLNFMNDYNVAQDFWDRQGNTMFWIVGNKPTKQAMQHALQEA